MGIGSGSGAQGNIPGVEPGSGSGFTGGTRSGSEPGWGSGSGEGPGPGFGIGGVDVVLGEPMYMSCSTLSDAVLDQRDANMNCGARHA